MILAETDQQAFFKVGIKHPITTDKFADTGKIKGLQFFARSSDIEDTLRLKIGNKVFTEVDTPTALEEVKELGYFILEQELSFKSGDVFELEQGWGQVTEVVLWVSELDKSNAQ